MRERDLTPVKVRKMLREAYLAGFTASSKDENAETMMAVNKPPIGDVKTNAREYALARVPQGMQS